MGIISGIIGDICTSAYCFGVDNFSDSYLNPHKSGSASTVTTTAPSENIDIYNVDIKEVEDKYDKDRASCDRRQYRTRAYTGYIVAVHVLSYLDGKEKLKNGWDIRNQEAANAVSMALGYCDLYHTGTNHDLSYFGYNDNIKNPIVTEEIIKKAMKDHPMSKDTIKLSRFFYPDKNEIVIGGPEPKPVVVKKEEAKTEPIETKEEANDEVPFDDSTVEVMDIEEDVIKASKESKDKQKEEVKPEAKKAETKSSINPIVDEFGNKYLDINSQEQQPLTKNQVEAFNKNFGEFLEKDKKYWLHRMKSGSIECVIQDAENSFRTVWIDPNKCVGNGWYCLGNIMIGPDQYDTVMVSAKEKDICKKIFTIPGYLLTPEEVQRCNSHLFENQRIYSIVDMGSMSDKLGNMKPDNFKKLGDKLSFIIDNMSDKEAGRFRITDFKNPDHFKMISDEKCWSPFPGQTRYNITDTKVIVNGNSVKYIDADGTERDCTIK